MPVKRGEEQPVGTFSVEEAQRHEAGFRMVFKRLLSLIEASGDENIIQATEYALESSAVFELLPEVKTAFAALDIIRRQNLSSSEDNKDTRKARTKQYINFWQILPGSSDYCKRMLSFYNDDFGGGADNLVSGIRKLLATAAYEDTLFEQLQQSGITID
jgi:hypothetical protein